MADCVAQLGTPASPNQLRLPLSSTVLVHLLRTRAAVPKHRLCTAPGGVLGATTPHQQFNEQTTGPDGRHRDAVDCGSTRAISTDCREDGSSGCASCAPRCGDNIGRCHGGLLSQYLPVLDPARIPARKRLTESLLNTLHQMSSNRLLLFQHFIQKPRAHGAQVPLPTAANHPSTKRNPATDIAQTYQPPCGPPASIPLRTWPRTRRPDCHTSSQASCGRSHRKSP